jgi:hypothetical protein
MFRQGLIFSVGLTLLPIAGIAIVKALVLLKSIL